MKDEKEPGDDQITAELLKNMGECGMLLLLKILNRVKKEDRRRKKGIPKD